MPRAHLRSIFCVSVVLATVLTSASLAYGDAYADGLEHAQRREKRGDLAGAASALDAMVPLYPQDYMVAMEAAWIHFRAGQPREAELYYRIALSRSPRQIDARLGLAWSIVRQRRCPEAVSEFRDILLVAPEDSSAKAGLSECSRQMPASTVSVGLSWTELRYPSNAQKSAGHGATLSFETRMLEHWLLGGAYRYTAFSVVDGGGLSPFHQSELYLRTGYTSRSLDVTLLGAIVSDGSGWSGTSRHVGTGLRASVGDAGDVRLNASVSLYRDRTFLRVEPSWRIPLSSRWSVIPGLAVQATDPGLRADASVTLWFQGERHAAWIGGKYGREQRPAYLAQSLVYDIPETIDGGIWVGAKVRLVRGVDVSLSYSVDRLESTSASVSSGSFLHSMTLGVGGTFLPSIS